MSKALQEKLRHVLANTVGSIVELPESALSVAVLSGKASLGPGLKIKKDVFEQLGMPVVLTAGSIESIEIDIPTTSLRTKPVVIRIRDVLIGLSPNPDANTRRAKLAAQERLWQQAGEEGEGIDPESAMGKMVQKIVDNIHIIVEDVHIRLEDTRTQSERYAMGLVLDRFSLRSYVVDRTGCNAS
jgi:vacuolar protein sorting-associated protein 13A/C